MPAPLFNPRPQAMPRDLTTPRESTDRAASLSLLVVDPNTREHEFWEHAALTAQQITIVGATGTIERALQLLERRVVDLVLVGPGLSHADVMTLLSCLRQLRMPPLTMVLLDDERRVDNSFRYDSGATFMFQRHSQVLDAIETLLTLSRNSEGRYA